MYIAKFCHSLNVAAERWRFVEFKTAVICRTGYLLQKFSFWGTILLLLQQWSRITQQSSWQSSLPSQISPSHHEKQKKINFRVM